jgi:hypothetical protein
MAANVKLISHSPDDVPQLSPDGAPDGRTVDFQAFFYKILLLLEL